MRLRMNEPYVYVLIRTDIPQANQAAQIAHAALEAGFRFQRPALPIRIVVSGVPSESALLRGVAQIEAENIAVEVFHEPDYPKGYTAACTEPIADARRSVMRRFSLLS